MMGAIKVKFDLGFGVEGGHGSAPIRQANQPGILA
jgi:hypothetical protein